MFNGYGSTILDGTWLTVQLALLSMAVAIALGLLGAAFRLSPVKWLALLGETYAAVIRGIPDLVLILLIFYGGQEMLNRVLELSGYEGYVDINPFVAGVGTLGFIYGAYFTETFRGAILAVPRGQVEAATAYGLKRGQRFRFVVFPQMMRFALPGIGNNWMVMLKATALVSIIGLADLVKAAQDAGKSTYQLFYFLVLAALIYLLITSASNFVLRRLERRYSAGAREAVR